jgi:hypothetical protein
LAEETGPQLRPDDDPARRKGVRRRGLRVEVDVRADYWGEILDFEARLAGIEGVQHISIVPIDNERARLVVDLRRNAREETA